MKVRMPSSYYLAVHSGHNGSCALMKDGVIVTAVQEERFSRIKNDVGYPKRAIAHCMKSARISGKDLAGVAYTTIDLSSVFVKSKHYVNFSVRDYIDFYGEKYYIKKLRGENCLEYLRWLRDDPQFTKQDPYYDFSYLSDEILLDPVKDSEVFRKERARMLAAQLGIEPAKVQFIDHHTCHAYYAYFGSPFRGEPCIVITLDSFGDGRNQTVWQAEGDRLTLLAESAQNNIAHIYKLTTLLLGMRPNEHEYKVMGLAPYAKRRYAEKALAVVQDILRIDGMRIVHNNRPRDLFTYLREGFAAHRFDNVASAVQLFTEGLMTRLVTNIYEKTGVTKYVISGGISMNVKMNKAVMNLPFVSDLFVCGSGSDESTCIGGCYYLNRKNANNAPLKNLYLGYDIADEFNSFDWTNLNKEFIVRTKVGYAQVAALLAKGDVVARVAGRAEFGARALGNRSILADPSQADVVQKINDAVKKRDFWMPFALSILKDHAASYIHNPKNIDSPHMTLVFDTDPARYDAIRAGTHPADHTVRLQFVMCQDDSDMYQIIEAFFKTTGVPAVLNTSFNLHGEPIVNSIADAVRTFRASGLDHLYVRDTLVSKKK